MNMRGRGGWNAPAYQTGFGMGPRGFVPPMMGPRGNFGPPRPAFGSMGFGGPGFGGMNAWSCDEGEEGYCPPGYEEFDEGPVMITPKQVMEWIDQQEPPVLRRILYHCKWNLEKRGAPVESVGFSDLEQEGEFDENKPTPVSQDNDEEDGGDMSGWYEGAAANITASPVGGSGGGGVAIPPPASLNRVRGGKVGKRGRPGFGFQRGGYFNTAGNGISTQMQWTPGGWAPKDNSHKVTTTIRPLPEPEVIPPTGEMYPEANADRNKLKALNNNRNMMSIELQKICRKHKIQNLDKDNPDLSQYPQEAQSRLQTAIQCVNAAEKTLKEFKEFLKEEKYKEWNEKQAELHAEKVKSMIGETPQGIPHKKPASQESNE